MAQHLRLMHCQITAVLDPVVNSIDLTWTGIQNATGYNIYRDDSYIDTVVSPATTYSDTRPRTADGYGTHDDPMAGHFIGGINVFSGGLALHSDHDTLPGAIGIGCDTPCADHTIAWRT